jgi:NAD(P)-dependent dehydrogenase (short-subunit alcohol dehydrogenase family)
MGRRQAELDKAVAEIGGEAYAVSGDVSKPADLDRLYSEVAAKKGKLDVVFANAAAIALDERSTFPSSELLMCLLSPGASLFDDL